MAERSSIQSGLPMDYYAPDYKIEVEGQILDQATKGDILDLKVTLDKDNLGHFDMTINNWDDRVFDFKYSNKAVFDIGNRVHIRMGYANQLNYMMLGVINRMSPRFPESGQPTLGVSGVDALIKLHGRKPLPKDVKTFSKMTAWEIAQIVAERNKLNFKTTEQNREKYEKYDLVVQKDQDELQFLTELAKRIDFDCFIRADPKSGVDTLYFVAPSDARDGQPVKVYEFEWGKNLIEFNPELTLSKQVGQVTVRGWNPKTKEVISYSATSLDLAQQGGGGLSGPEAAEKRLEGKQELVIDRPVQSQQEARDLAVALLRERSYEFLTGSGRVIGLSDLRPGDNLELKGLGKRFTGRYYVTKVEHSLGNSGYQTQFYVRKEYDGGLQ